MKKTLLIILCMIVLFTFSASSQITPQQPLRFDGEVINADLTKFEWCFSPGWEDISLMKEKLNVYSDNLGCELESFNVYAVTPVTVRDIKCSVAKSCEAVVSKENITTYECTEVETCEDEVIYERYDLEKTDYLFPKGSRICYEAKRKAKVGNQACDMNFETEVEGISFDVKDFGKAWWNSTWEKKRALNVSGNTTISDIQVRANISHVTGMNSDFTDLRFTNEYENDTLDYWVESFEASSWVMVWIEFDELNNSNDVQGYMYYGNAGAGNVSDGTGTFKFYDDFNDGSINASKWTNNSGSGGSYTETGGFLRLVSTVNPNLGSTYTAGTPIDDNTTVFIRINNSQGQSGVSRGTDTVFVSSDYEVYYTTGTELFYRTDGGTTSLSNVNYWQATTEANISYQYSDEQWYADEFGVTGSGLNNDPQITMPQEFQLWARDSGAADGHTYVDYVRIAKWSPFVHAVTVGDEQENVLGTNLAIALYNTTYAPISNTTSENEPFWVIANYTYSDNGTALDDTLGFCNYSADEIIDEVVITTPGVNTTVCTSGCDTTNQTFTITGQDEDGFIHDTYLFRLCRNGAALGNTFSVANNYSGLYTFNYNEIPICSAGWVNFTVLDANTSGVSDFTVSIWSSATSLARSLQLVDNHLDFDRFHNHTANMIWNSTLGSWTSENIHTYLEHGSKEINISCFENVSGNAANQTELLSVVVENIPPVVIIDSIWWWLLSDPVIFTDGVEAKYPLESTLNVSAVVVDDDLANFTCYLNFSNGTNIDSKVLFGGDKQENFSQGNFSTDLAYLDGTLGYVFQIVAIDTTDNVTSVQRSFDVVNDVPTVSWLNTTGLSIGVVPATFNFSCSDDEVETTTAFVYVNDTLNTSGLGLSGFVFNDSVGDWSLDVSCADSFRNSTNATLNFTYSAQCLINVVSPCSGCRYADDTVSLQFNCSNSISPDSCYYSINDFSNMTIANCSAAVNISAERGWNRLLLTTVNGGSSTESSFSFWAKKRDSTVFEYPVIWFIIALGLFFMLVAVVTRVFVFHFVSAMFFSYVGWELISMSVSFGYLTIIVSAVYGISMAVLGMRDP